MFLTLVPFKGGQGSRDISQLGAELELGACAGASPPVPHHPHVPCLQLWKLVGSCHPVLKVGRCHHRRSSI